MTSRTMPIRNRNAARRSGVSLMEILVTVFVMSVGLVGVIAMIPLGGHQMKQATIDDRSSACGRAALADLRVWDWLDPAKTHADPTSPATPVSEAPDSLWVTDGQLVQPYVIDPYFSTDPNVGSPPEDRFHFPAGTTSDSIRRVRIAPLADGVFMTPAIAMDLAQWHDDLLFDRELGDDFRPQLVFESATGRPAFEAQYSWMATVQPLFDPNSPTMQYEVSTVVFYQRIIPDPDAAIDPTTEAEKVQELAVDIDSSSVLGGLVSNVTLAPPDANQGLLLRSILPEARWLALVGKNTDAQGNPVNQDLIKWYRVVATYETGSDPADPVVVTLVGPDWHGVPSDTEPMEAYIPRGVVGVYTTTISRGDDFVWGGN